MPLWEQMEAQGKKAKGRGRIAVRNNIDRNYDSQKMTVSFQIITNQLFTRR
jgi:hypothetical protein